LILAINQVSFISLGSHHQNILIQNTVASPNGPLPGFVKAHFIVHDHRSRFSRNWFHYCGGQSTASVETFN